MEQCLKCANRLFFEPLPAEVFTCCAIGESVEDINLLSGVSTKVAKYGSGEIECSDFQPGESICKTKKEAPFYIHPTRMEGEKYLLKQIAPCDYQI